MTTTRQHLSPFAWLTEEVPRAQGNDRDPRGVDDRLLAQALAEARKGVGRTHPNPPVGAVIARGERVISVGHHARAGTAHAEVAAIENAREPVRGATMYVTLEPCDHHGRTPPCSLRLVEEGIARVVVGTRDPNPRVHGRGIRRLRAAGIDVEVRTPKDALGAQCAALIAPFSTSITEQRPYVVAKVAASLDGRIACRNGDSRWVTGPHARALVHRLRDAVDAVIVGSGTVAADDPELTVRVKVRGRRLRDPLRVVVDSRLTTRTDARVYAKPQTRGGAGALVLHGNKAGAAARRAFDAAGVERLAFGAARVPLEDAFAALAKRGVTSLLVEPGPRLLAPLLAGGLVDEVWWFVAPKLVGGDGISATPAFGLDHMTDALAFAPGSTTARVGDDLLIIASLAR